MRSWMRSTSEARWAFLARTVSTSAASSGWTWPRRASSSPGPISVGRPAASTISPSTITVSTDRAVQRHEGGIVETQEREIRPVAGPDGADLALEPERPGAAEGGGAERLGGGAGLAGLPLESPEQRERLHGLEDVLGVVAAAVIAADGQMGACRGVAPERRDPVHELQVAHGIEGEVCAGGAEALDLGVAYPHAVRHREGRPEQPHAVEVRDQGLIVGAVGEPGEEGLRPGLVDVREHLRAGLT